MPEEKMKTEEIARLLDTMVAPKRDERMLFLADYPEGKMTEKQLGRQNLLLRWYKAASRLAAEKGFSVLACALYRQTGKNNSDLPKTAATQGGGHVDNLPELIASANIVIAMTEYSASAPLRNIAAKTGSLRVVSMPKVEQEMEMAMSADYKRIEERGRKLLAIVENATSFELTFDGAGIPRNTKLFMDTRASNWQLDAGMCKKAGDFINFPSGELFTPPYEGVSPEGRTRFGDSRTEGTWPVYSPADKKVAFLKVEKNRIVRVQGDSLEAQRIIDDIADDENAANIAELGLGLNEKARSGEWVPILEKEKAGPHIAYGRNDHFGTPLTMAGKVKANVHIDYVYTRTTPITASVYAVFPNGNRVLIAERGKITAV